MASTLDNLKAAIATFEERNAVYGSTWKRHGAVLAALYPAGISLVSPEEHVRFHIINQLVLKIARYTASPGGHADSARDMMVYAAILEEVTAPSCDCEDPSNGRVSEGCQRHG